MAMRHPGGGVGDGGLQVGLGDPVVALGLDVARADAAAWALESASRSKTLISMPL